MMATVGGPRSVLNWPFALLKQIADDRALTFCKVFIKAKCAARIRKAEEVILGRGFCSHFGLPG